MGRRQNFQDNDYEADIKCIPGPTIGSVYHSYRIDTLSEFKVGTSVSSRYVIFS